MVDLMPEFESTLQRTASTAAEQQLAEVKKFIAAHAALYAPSVVGVPDAATIARSSLPSIRSRNGDIERNAAVLHERLPAYLHDFAAHFPDFRCNFTIYMMPSFGAFDGAGRFVDGKPAMVLGVDTISALEKSDQLKVFIDHEIFHRYHFQAAGFSDDGGDGATIVTALWAEGLATYVSAALNPDRPLADALLLPRDLEERAQPHVASIAAELRANLERKDVAVYEKYFAYGSRAATAAKLPWRSGYYVGYLVAKRLAQDTPLQSLAHWRGDDLTARIAAALDELAAGPESLK